jgi:hypothetical protein
VALNLTLSARQDKNYEMVQEWREHIDEYNKMNGGETRAMFTQAYTSIDNNLRYYADSEGNPRAHFPFNGFLMTDLNVNSTARVFKQTIDKWMELMPIGATPNWVVSEGFVPNLQSFKVKNFLSLAITTSQDSVLATARNASMAC